MEAKKAKDEIVKRLGIRETTFYTWLRRYGEILEREGIIKFTRKGKRKETAEIDVERFIEFIKKRGEQPKETIKWEHLFVSELENFLTEESSKGNFIVLKNPTILEKEKFSFDFVCLFPSAVVTFYSRSSFTAKEFFSYLSKLLFLQEKLKKPNLYHFAFYITKNKIDESSIEILLELKKEELKVATYVCYTNKNVKCCTEKFKKDFLKLEELLSENTNSEKEEEIFKNKPHVFKCS